MSITTTPSLPCADKFSDKGTNADIRSTLKGLTLMQIGSCSHAHLVIDSLQSGVLIIHNAAGRFVCETHQDERDVLQR